MGGIVLFGIFGGKGRKWMGALLVLALMLVGLAPFASADTQMPQQQLPTLRVQSKYTVSVAPDQAFFVAGMQSENADAKLAQQTVDETMVKLLADIKALGIEEKDIQTTRLEVQPVYTSVNFTGKPKTFRAVHLVAITVRDLDKVGAAVDAAVASGANYIDRVWYVLDDRQPAYQEALGKAIAQGVERAQLMATAAGVTLGDLQQLNEIQQYDGYMGKAAYSSMDMRDAVAEYDMGSAPQAGQTDIVAEVEIVYNVK